MKLRAEVVAHNAKWVKSVNADDRKVTILQVRAEMQEDKQWVHVGKWNWEKYEAYAAKPNVFGSVEISKFINK